MSPTVGRRCGSFVLNTLPLVAVLFAPLLTVVLVPQPAEAYIRPDEFQTLQWFTRLVSNRSINWVQALHTWKCPTPAANSNSRCDPCGKGSSGNWDHINCRGPSNGTGESGRGIIDGYITTMHITDQLLNGPPPKELCNFKHIRELDLDGGHLTGPLPEWPAECLPYLQELDMSFNAFTGTLPAMYAQVPFLQEIKIEQNQVIGPIPWEYGNMPILRRLRLHNNQMSGTLPDTLRNTSDTLWDVQLDVNDFSGDLSVLSKHQLAQVTLNDNPNLCGMVPSSVRYAHGYNTARTRLGQPC